MIWTLVLCRRPVRISLRRRCRISFAIGSGWKWTCESKTICQLLFNTLQHVTYGDSFMSVFQVPVPDELYNVDWRLAFCEVFESSGDSSEFWVLGRNYFQVEDWLCRQVKYLYLDPTSAPISLALESMAPKSLTLNKTKVIIPRTKHGISPPGVKAPTAPVAMPNTKYQRGI